MNTNLLISGARALWGAIVIYSAFQLGRHIGGLEIKAENMEGFRSSDPAVEAIREVTETKDKKTRRS